MTLELPTWSFGYAAEIFDQDWGAAVPRTVAQTPTLVPHDAPAWPNTGAGPESRGHSTQFLHTINNGEMAELVMAPG